MGANQQYIQDQMRELKDICTGFNFVDELKVSQRLLALLCLVIRRSPVCWLALPLLSWSV